MNTIHHTYRSVHSVCNGSYKNNHITKKNNGIIFVRTNFFDCCDELTSNCMDDHERMSIYWGLLKANANVESNYRYINLLIYISHVLFISVSEMWSSLIVNTS